MIGRMLEGRTEEDDAAMPAHFFELKYGTTLYHYTSVNASVGILENKALWLSDFTRMNDASEYVYARACLLENYQARQRYVDLIPRLIFSNALLGLEANTTMFVGCLSQDDQDAHQWQHYGAHGAGCAIGLDASLLAEAGVAMRRVVYDRAEFDRFTAAGIDMLQTQFEEEPDDLLSLQELARYFVSDLFAFKHPDFADEKEIRMSRMLVRTEPGGTWRDVGGHDRSGGELPALEVHVRNGAQGMTSYISLPLETRAGCAIRSLTLGPECPGSGPEVDRLLAACANLDVRRTLA